MSIDLTGKNKFAWFVLHAEAESGVVQGFKVQGAIQPGGPTVAGGSGTITLADVRARSKPTYASIDDIEEEEEELLGTHVHGWGQAVAKHNGMFSMKKKKSCLWSCGTADASFLAPLASLPLDSHLCMKYCVTSSMG